MLIALWGHYAFRPLTKSLWFYPVAQLCSQVQIYMTYIHSLSMTFIGWLITSPYILFAAIRNFFSAYFFLIHLKYTKETHQLNNYGRLFVNEKSTNTKRSRPKLAFVCPEPMFAQPTNYLRSTSCSYSKPNREEKKTKTFVTPWLLDSLTNGVINHHDSPIACIWFLVY